ncbi:unnamed protein product [Allacma fusca]|uniref:ubiquitinyl hydrolase 1 n=1 Tax=Allacma fusca TaxID=39272 RepID=A0A8J2K775_9HEXA|nr:unnamed protein product [Allacma fusca]
MNCWKLSKYFMAKEYERFLNQNKPRNAALIRSYSELVSQAYNERTRIVTPAEVKRSMGAIYGEYRYNDEQDVIEFITRMLDTLHEGLISEARPNAEGTKMGRWNINKSIITDLFFFSLTSTLQCHECGESKISIEPAMCLSLPVPPRRRYRDDVVLFYMQLSRSPVRIHADVTLNVLGLKELLRTEYLALEKVVCLWYNGSRSMVELGDHAVLNDIHHRVFCYEYSEAHLSSYCWIQLKIRKLSMDRSLRFNILVQSLAGDEFSMMCVRDVLFHLLPKENLWMLDDLAQYFKLENCPTTPSDGGVLGLPVASIVCSNHEENRSLGSSYDPLDMIIAGKPPLVCIQDCLDRLLEMEELSVLLHCNRCSTKQRFSKTMNVENLPKYLIVHLKRFEYVNSLLAKISTLVEYPLDGFMLRGTEYRVIGICNHDSDRVISSGHYVSYVRKECWYLCNDQIIRKVNGVDKKHTYALFLERCE